MRNVQAARCKDRRKERKAIFLFRNIQHHSWFSRKKLGNISQTKQHQHPQATQLTYTSTTLLAKQILVADLLNDVQGSEVQLIADRHRPTIVQLIHLKQCFIISRMCQESIKKEREKKRRINQAVVSQLLLLRSNCFLFFFPHFFSQNSRSAIFSVPCCCLHPSRVSVCCLF